MELLELPRALVLSKGRMDAGAGVGVGGAKAGESSGAVGKGATRHNNRKHQASGLFFLADWINHIEEALFVATKSCFVSFTHQVRLQCGKRTALFGMAFIGSD